jgi:hypothetical protein
MGNDEVCYKNFESCLIGRGGSRTCEGGAVFLGGDGASDWESLLETT